MYITCTALLIQSITMMSSTGLRTQTYLIIGASEASPLMTPKPYFRPDICRYIYIYIYICLVRTSYRKSPFARPKMAAHPLHPGSCTLYRGGGLPQVCTLLRRHTAADGCWGQVKRTDQQPLNSRRWCWGSEKNGPATLEQPPMVVGTSEKCTLADTLFIWAATSKTTLD